MKTVLVIGASRGIGKYLVDSLMPDYLVGTCSRRAVEVETDNFLSMRCDVRSPDDVGGFAQTVLQKFGHIDVMIYNAGLMLFDDLINARQTNLDEMYKVMVKGYLFACQAVIPMMSRVGGGHIINISSTRGLTAAPGKCAYSAMKRAATSITDSVRIENKQRGIKTTSLHLGMVYTESSREMYGEEWYSLFPIAQSDVFEAVKFVMSRSQHAHIDSMVIGGML